MFGESFTSSVERERALVRLHRHRVGLRRVERRALGGGAARRGRRLFVARRRHRRRSRRRERPPRVRGSGARCASGSTSSTTVPNSPAGRRSPAFARSRGHCARRSGSSTPASRTSRSPAAPTPASTRSGRSRRSTSKGGPPVENAAEALNTMLPDDLVGDRGRGGPGRLRRPPLGPGAHVPLPDLAAADAVAVRAAAQLVVPAADRRVEARRRGRPARSASTTSAPSRRPRRSTSSSSARCGARPGTCAATRSSSRSPPTASSATWCGRSSGR